MAGSDWAVELEDVHLTLVSAAGPVNVLRGIDLAVAPGESVAVVARRGPAKPRPCWWPPVWSGRPVAMSRSPAAISAP